MQDKYTVNSYIEVTALIAFLTTTLPPTEFPEDTWHFFISVLFLFTCASTSKFSKLHTKYLYF